MSDEPLTDRQIAGLVATDVPETAALPLRAAFEVENVEIAAIHIGERCRRDLGDIDELAAIMSTNGLLQPIGVTPERELIWGQRRVEAARRLGWETIPARVVWVVDTLDAEVTENIVRKDFTVSERVRIGQMIEARLGERRGGDHGNQHTGGKWQKVDDCQGRTDEIASRKAGFGNRETYRQAKAACANGCDELVRLLDGGQLSITAADKVASLPREEQQRILASGEATIAASLRNLGRRGGRCRIGLPSPLHPTLTSFMTACRSVNRHAGEAFEEWVGAGCPANDEFTAAVALLLETTANLTRLYCQALHTDPP